MKLLKLEIHPGGMSVYVNPDNVVAIFDVDGHANLKTTAGGDRATIAVKQSVADIVAMLSDEVPQKEKTKV